MYFLASLFLLVSTEVSSFSVHKLYRSKQKQQQQQITNLFSLSLLPLTPYTPLPIVICISSKMTSQNEASLSLSLSLTHTIMPSSNQNIISNTKRLALHSKAQRHEFSCHEFTLLNNSDWPAVRCRTAFVAQGTAQHSTAQHSTAQPAWLPAGSFLNYANVARSICMQRATKGRRKYCKVAKGEISETGSR